MNGWSLRGDLAYKLASQEFPADIAPSEASQVANSMGMDELASKRLPYTADWLTSAIANVDACLGELVMAAFQDVN